MKIQIKMRTTYTLNVYCNELFNFSKYFRPELINAKQIRQKYTIIYTTQNYMPAIDFLSFIDILELSDIRITRINKCVYDIIKHEFASKREFKTYLDANFMLYD